jgi:Phosphotransferase enzyme family
LIYANEPFAPSVEPDRSKHALCALASALSLIAGRLIRVPKQAYPYTSPSRLARLLQVGNGAWELLLSVGRQKTLVSGKNLAYREGEVEYFTGHIFKHLRSFSSLKRPFFVLTGTDPAESIAATTGCDPQPAPRLWIPSHHCVLVIMANWRGSPAVLHYSACTQGIAELRRQVKGHEIGASDPQIAHLVPRVLAHATLSNGAAVLARTRVPGQPPEFSWRRVDVANELWLSRKHTSEGAGRARLGQRLDQLRESLPRFRDLFLPPMSALLEWCESTRIPGGIAHGDFWYGNVLYQGDSVSGIIDWEWAQRDGFPQVDALYMLLGSVISRGASLARLLRQLWADEIGDASLSGRIANLGVQSGLDRDDLKFIALMLWFNNLWERAMEGSMLSASWSEDMVAQTVPTIMKWLARHKKTTSSGGTVSNMVG